MRRQIFIGTVTILIAVCTALIVGRGDKAANGASRNSVERVCGSALPGELKGEPLDTDVEAIVVPVCDQKLFIPDAWIRQRKFTFDCPHDDATGWSARVDKAVSSRRTCPVVIASFASRAPAGLNLAPEFSGMLPHFIGLSPFWPGEPHKRAEVIASNAQRAPAPSDAVPDADGYWHSEAPNGFSEWVLMKPTYPRPGGIPLRLWCHGGLNLAKQICRGYVNYGALRVVYDFVADDKPKSTWEMIDHNVVRLIQFIIRSED